MTIEVHYFPQKVEAQTQAYWDENKTFVCKEDPNKESFYCLSMFPYPSGHLHVGHVRNYTIGDVIARFKRFCWYGMRMIGSDATDASMDRCLAPVGWGFVLWPRLTMVCMMSGL